jgi:hypothetical protein
MVSTATPLERNESRVQRAITLFFSPSLSGVIVKFHFKAGEVRNGNRWRQAATHDYGRVAAWTHL